MTGTLLLRGMLVGLITGLLCFAFLKVAGEPSVDRAIAFESQMAAAELSAAPARRHEAEDAANEHGGELVSRPVQSGFGLFTGVVIYNAAFGGLFALAFALFNGRIGSLGPQAAAALLAALGFIAVALVPGLKFPANPPSVGEADTIGMRTTLYFALIAVSLAVMIGCMFLRERLLPRFCAWNAALIAGGVYIVMAAAVCLLAPSVNEVPAHFPAALLWDFRVAAMGAQALMWSSIGLLFGALTARAAAVPGQAKPAGVKPA